MTMSAIATQALGTLAAMTVRDAIAAGWNWFTVSALDA